MILNDSKMVQNSYIWNTDREPQVGTLSWPAPAGAGRRPLPFEEREMWTLGVRYVYCGSLCICLLVFIMFTMFHYVLHQSNTETVWWLYPFDSLRSSHWDERSESDRYNHQTVCVWLVLILVNLSEPLKQSNYYWIISKWFQIILNDSKWF